MMKWHGGICRSNDIHIHYHRTGGATPPVVLLHGLIASGACWTPLARTLEDAFDVVMPDARGHGESDAPDEGYGYDDHAADVIGLIDALGLSAPVALGHSMGGMTAAVAASRSAGRIRALVLADPTFLEPERQREVFESDVAAQQQRLLQQDLSDVIAQLQARHPHRAPELVELIARARLQTRMSAFDVLRPPNPDWRALMRAIDVPILLLIGDAGVLSLETAQELQRLNPRVRIEQIRDAGHALQYEQPERFASLVRTFLRELCSVA